MKQEATLHLLSWDCIRLTWLPNPMPMPRNIRPMISIAMFIAAALKTAPAKKLSDPTMMLILLPLILVTYEAANVETRPAKYRDDVKSVRI